MNVLYGVTSDGNGHIARATALGRELRQRGVNVTALFSGASNIPSVDSEAFSEVMQRQGYGRSVNNGSVNMFRTVFKNVVQLPRLAQDILTLDLSQYDLVISDFEPVSAFSRRVQNLLSGQHLPSVGIANQFSYERDVPCDQSFLIKNAHSLARAKTRIGMHFHDFGQEGILPPFINDGLQVSDAIPNKILVYLGFESPKDIEDFLSPYKDHRFCVYSKFVSDHYVTDNMSVHPLSRDGFRRDFTDCDGVITNAGFMTPSEALSLGKKILLKPLDGHPEQMSNAMALSGIGAAHTMTSFDRSVLEDFLDCTHAPQIKYPCVASSVADWIVQRDYSLESANDMCRKLWSQVTYKNLSL